MSSGDDLGDVFDSLDLVDMAENAEKVRGQHYVHWWPEVERLERAEQWGEYEALLTEMRDATERGAQLAGWTLVSGAATRLADLYVERGDQSAAIAELERYIAAVDQYRTEEPTGGDTGYRNAQQYLAKLKEEG